MARLKVCVLVLDAKVGQRDLTVDDLEAVPLCNALARVLLTFLTRKLHQLAIQISFQFVVQNNAHRTATGALDSGRLLLIKAVQSRVVLGFFRFVESVVRGLLFGQTARASKEVVTTLG